MVDVVVKNKSQNKETRNGNKQPKKKQTRLSKILYTVVILVLIATAGYFFWQYQDLRNNPERAIEQETTQIIQQVGRLMSLPEDETPTIATVEDVSRLDSQPFFNRAENGDKILIYTEARQAIIYRESERKIINVGPIALNASGDEQE